MAEIPVERKSMVSWWMWVIIAILVILLIWWIVEALEGPDETAVVAAPAAQVAPAATPAFGEAITDPIILVALPDRRPLIGRTVRLTDVKVLDVLGDQAFWIGSSKDNRVLVAMQEVPPPANPTDAAININPGQTVNLTGQVRAMPPMVGADREAVDRLFGPAFAKAAEKEQIYIFARAADVVARP